MSKYYFYLGVNQTQQAVEDIMTKRMINWQSNILFIPNVFQFIEEQSKKDGYLHSYWGIGFDKEALIKVLTDNAVNDVRIDNK